MSDISLEIEKYISSNKEILSVLPVNTKKNRSKYVEKVSELRDAALKIRQVILTEIEERYDKIVDITENPNIARINKNIESIGNIDLFNELNTPYEKLEFDKIIHSLHCFFEGNFDLVNQNIKLFIDKFKDFGIELTEDDFTYSKFTNEYIKVFFEEIENFSSDRLKKTFEDIYWKCPDIVTHIELNLRYLYYINAKKIEKELNDRNDRVLSELKLNKNKFVQRFFDLNKELIEIERIDQKRLLDKFVNGEWKIKDFANKEMEVLYEKLYIGDYFASTPEKQEEINNNFVSLLHTLQEYNVYIKYKYIIDDLKKKYKNKDSFKDAYEKKNKELRKKEQELVKENEKHKRNIKRAKSLLFVFFRRKIKREIYAFPVLTNEKIKEINNLYIDLDEEMVNTRIAEFVDENCSIKYMFKIVTSFYTYNYNLIKEHYKDDPDVDVTEELQELLDFINQPYKVMLNNVKLAEEPNITSIISNRYQIMNIRLEKEDLEENLDTLIQDVEKIVNYYNIKKSNLDINDITFIEKVKPMLSKR